MKSMREGTTTVDRQTYQDWKSNFIKSIKSKSKFSETAQRLNDVMQGIDRDEIEA